MIYEFATTCLILSAILILSLVFIKRQKVELYDQTLKLGIVSMNYFVNNAGIPMIDNNILRLNTLVEAVNDVKFSIIGITTLIVIIGVIVTIWLSVRFSRPILKLVTATRELSIGNYQNRVDLKTNDEVRDLSMAFNRMSKELWLKSLMQESFGKYVGSEVLQMIMAHPESSWVKGKRLSASILFADIRGFTAYAQDKEPENIVTSLNEYFDIALNTLTRYGFIDKLIGDAVLAVFGVPVFQENHEELAVRAAMELQENLKKAGSRGNELLSRVGISINSGVVVAGNIGSHVKMEYTVIGNAVNMASRINSLAGAGEIIISDTVFLKVEGLFNTLAMAPQKVKGRDNPVSVYKILGLKDC